jgi:hypothetical protein
VLVILPRAHLAGPGLFSIQIIHADLAACLTIKSLCKVFARPASYHALNARVISKDAQNAKEIIYFTMLLVSNTAP